MKRIMLSLNDFGLDKPPDYAVKLNFKAMDSEVFLQNDFLKEFYLYLSYENKTAELRQRVFEKMLLDLEVADKTVTSKKEVNEKEEHLDLSAWSKHACPICGGLAWIRIHRSFWQKLLYPHKKRCQCLSCYHKFWLD